MLEAGPEAAGATAALLAQSGSDTVDTVNSLYDQINKASEQFGTKMSETFYGNAVSMAKAMVDGAQSEYTNIMTEMTSIYNGIKDKLTPLKDVGTNVGEDLIQAMIDKLNARKAELIALAQSIAAAVAAAMQSAAAGIGVGVSTYIPPKTTTPPPTGDSASADAQKELDDANAALADALAELDKSTTDLSKVLDGLGSTSTKTSTAISGLKTVTVKSGDTLSAIAKANGTTLSKILDLNPKFEDVAKYQGGNMIWAGTTVKVPTAPSVTSSPAYPSYSGVNTTTMSGINAASGTTNIAAGAVTVNLSSNVPAEDVEPIMTRALLNALGAR